MRLQAGAVSLAGVRRRRWARLASSRRDSAWSLLAVAAAAVALGAALVLLERRPILLAAVAGVAVLPGFLAFVAARSEASEARPTATASALGALAVVLVGAGVGAATLNALRVPTWLIDLVGAGGFVTASNVTYGDALLVAGGAALLLGILAGARIPRPPVWLVASGAGILIAGLIAAFGSPSLDVDVLPVFRFVIALVGVPLLIAWAIRSRGALRLVVTCWLAAAAIACLFGISERLGLTNLEAAITGHAWNTYTQRVAGLTTHPNHLALVAAMALPIALSRAFTTPAGMLRSIRSLGYALVAAVLMGGVLLSGSRAGLVAATAGVLVAILLHERRARALVTVILVAVVGVVALNAFGPDEGALGSAAERLTGADASALRSDEDRVSGYRQAIERVGENPVYGEGFSKIRSAHDIYLQLLQGGGLIALAAFAWFAFGALSTGRRLVFRGDLPPEERALASAAFASLFAWLLYGIAQNAIYDRYLYIPVGILLALHLWSKRPSWRGAAPGAADSPRRLADSPAYAR
jgi:O-Antigen ligase